MHDAASPPWGSAALASAVLFGLYALTLAPTTAFWDASEYIATGYILGIPHPPGNPLFVALARSWIVLLEPTGLPVAVRVNLLAALTSAAAGGFFFLVAHRVLAGLLEVPWAARAGAWAAALLGGTAYTVWHQSTVNEKVYTISVLVVAAVSWLAVRWRDTGDDRYLLGALYLMVLGSTNHLMSLLPLPALAVFVLLSGAGVLARRRFWMRAVPAVLVGLSFNVFLPIRAAQDPVINEGEPVCESALGVAAAVYTQGAAGCPALAASLTREQYAKPPVTDRQAPFGHQLLNWFQYFDWQWARGVSPDPTPGNARLPMTLLFLGLGLAGLWAAWSVDREVAAYLTVLAAVLSVGLVFYLNFRYGYSLAPEVQDRSLHEVRERDYFFIAGFMLWGVLAGIGVAWVWAVVASVIAAVGRGRALAFSAPVLLVALLPLALNRGWASRAGDWAARDWAYDLLMSVEPYGVLFTNGDNDTFPLWYVQEVEGLRKDVTVVVGQYLYTSWYPGQLRRLTSPGRQRPFRAEGVAGALYDPPARPPTGPILAAAEGELARLQGGVLPGDVTISFPELAVTFPGGMPFLRGERLALDIIRDSAGERPIYFSSRAGMLTDLGLERWGVRQGLVTKLAVRPVGEDAEQPPGLVRGDARYGGEWYDLERSRTLWDDVYRFRGLRDRAVWPDLSTSNVPWQFYATALQLADVAQQAGAGNDYVGGLLDHAQRFLTTSRGGTRGTPPPAASEDG